VNSRHACVDFPIGADDTFPERPSALSSWNSMPPACFKFVFQWFSPLFSYTFPSTFPYLCLIVSLILFVSFRCSRACCSSRSYWMVQGLCSCGVH
jgi:hypothetical protein